VPRTRRAFLSEVGTGMLTAAVGPALVADLGLGPALAEEAQRPGCPLRAAGRAVTPARPSRNSLRPRALLW
jgi:hypothetical protein